MRVTKARKTSKPRAKLSLDEQVEQEEALAAALAGSREGHGRLYEVFKPMIRSIASKYSSDALDHDDLMQLGAIGLMNAVRLHVPERGRFSTFAYAKITGAILDGMRDARRLPRRDSECYEAALAVRSGIVSLDTAQTDDTTGAGIVPDPGGEPSAGLEFEAESKELATLLVEGLGPRRASIFLLRSTGMLLEEIGQLHGLKNTRISQIMAEIQPWIDLARTSGIEAAMRAMPVRPTQEEQLQKLRERIFDALRQAPGPIRKLQLAGLLGVTPMRIGHAVRHEWFRVQSRIGVSIATVGQEEPEPPKRSRPRPSRSAPARPRRCDRSCL